MKRGRLPVKAIAYQARWGVKMVNDIANNMQLGLQSDVCVLDFSKAFDKVGHKRLVEKLKMYGIDGETNTWIKDFLSDGTQSVLVDGSSSGSSPVTPRHPVYCKVLYWVLVSSCFTLTTSQKG